MTRAPSKMTARGTHRGTFLALRWGVPDRFALLDQLGGLRRPI